MTSLSLSLTTAKERLRQFLYQIVIGAVVIGNLVGCAERHSEHGHVINPTDLETIQIGISNRNDILASLGKPSFEGAFEENRLYYTSQRMIQPIANKKTIDSQIIYIFTLDDKQILQSIDLKKHEEDGMKIAHIDEKTPSPGVKFGLAEQIFTNLKKRRSSK
jgi:outer membrane protein assembly factor BamE (lipoprotein component of BamABCDE complex)